VNKPVLLHTNIDERAEVNDIADGSLKLHSNSQVAERPHGAAEYDRRRVVANITPWFLKFGDNVADCRQAGAKLGGKRGQITDAL
jgi:hypothetical protein